MISADLPDNEDRRLEELYSYDILDSVDEKEFDDLTRLASDICDTPIALISLVDPQRQWFKSRVGIDARETSRDIAFCAHAILQDDIFVVEDTFKDKRFVDNPLVTGDPKIRFYAGAPLITPAGYPLGTLCIIGDRPKKLSDWQRNALAVLRNEVVSRLELKKKIQQLEASNRFKSIFVSNVSHEIRTPMHGVMGLIDLLAETPLNSKQRHYTQAIKRSAESLMRIINDVLDLSKVESGKLTIEDVSFNLDDVLKDIVDCYNPLAEEKGIDLRNEIEPKRHHFSGDPYRLKQIFGNLISNAIKFTDRGRVVLRMSVLQEEDKQALLRFSVIDTGMGLSEKQQSVLFERFQQADEHIARDYGGSGLGLSICKQLLALMGGEIGIKSEVGKGSNFWFTLPLKVVKDSTDDTGQGVDGDVQFTGSVLVAEDNRVNQIVAKGVLEKLGLSVDIAENGAVALTKLRDNFYDIVFMDCHMPVMSGFEATKAIRSENTLVHNPGVPVVAMTANAMEDDKEACFAVGMNEFIPKPLNREQLITVLGAYLKPVTAESSVEQEPSDIFESIDGYEVFNRATLKALKLDPNHLNIVVRTFLDTTPKEINKLSQAMSDNDVTAIRMIAHSIKGSARMLGGEQMGALASFVEHNAELGDELPSRKIISYLDACFERLEEALDAPTM